MCTPQLSMATQAFGVGMSTVGAFTSAAAQQSSLRSQARIAEINAQLADAGARAELFASERAQNAIKLRGAQTKAAQTAGYAAHGIDVGSQTAVNVATSTDYITEVDANTARANGIQAAWGRRIEASNYRANARSLRASASGISPLMSAATTLISGAGQVAQSWYSLNKTGAFAPKSQTGSVSADSGGAGFAEPTAGTPGSFGLRGESLFGSRYDAFGFPVTNDGIAVRY